MGIIAKQDLFPYSVSSSLQEAAPLYLTIKEPRPLSTHHDYYQYQHRKDYYVNNAKILEEYSYYSKDGANKQLLYVIDDVLEPYIPSGLTLPPLAMELVRNPSIYQIDEALGAFANRVSQENQNALFERAGNHTFFVPIGIGDNLNRLRAVDAAVIRGHVIPNHVLFVRAMGGQPYQSAAFDGAVNVELSLINRTIRFNSEQSYYAQSNTLKTDPAHNKGVVMSRIVRANIPVKNGVIHLIEKPLMIIDISIADFLTMEQTARLTEFNRLLNYAPDVRSEISSLQQKTILAPTNAAFEQLKAGSDPNDDKIRQLIDNPNELKELLRLHMVMQSVSTDDIRSGIRPEVLSADNRRSLYFRVVGDDKHRLLTVEGGGVNATAVQADIGATNGIIHIIDRVLGMPFQNLFQKLQSDPNLRTSYQLGTQGRDNWNEELGNENTRFTYFVPSDVAWNEFERENPSEFKQLTEGMASYQARKVTRRYLTRKEKN